ncbi:Unknown protein, partial [Striga hermonthica]
EHRRHNPNLGLKNKVRKSKSLRSTEMAEHINLLKAWKKNPNRSQNVVDEPSSTRVEPTPAIVSESATVDNQPLTVEPIQQVIMPSHEPIAETEVSQEMPEEPALSLVSRRKRSSVSHVAEQMKK